MVLSYVVRLARFCNILVDVFHHLFPLKWGFMLDILYRIMNGVFLTLQTSRVYVDQILQRTD